ncbi:MAG: MotA/TolQ/ExbB proton channel family protein [Gammaproteobacteria bacterium]
MFEIIKAGGWIMFPIIICSIIALAIIVERFWTLQRRRVIPDHLVAQIWQWTRNATLTKEQVKGLREGSPLGRVLAAGLDGRDIDRGTMKEKIEETGRHVVHELERFLNALGTIAAITPLLGLLGTVIGMIKVFSVITAVGVGDPGELAGGISQALLTTAAGISVAIPALIFHRFFRARIDEFVVEMEQEAMKMVEVMQEQRRLTAARRVEKSELQRKQAGQR